MSKRLTYRTEDGWVGVNDKTNGVVSTNSQAVQRLADIEDVLEKYGIDTVEELDGVLKPLIENGELESWKSAMFWKMQTEKLQAHWEKLKKFIEMEHEMFKSIYKKHSLVYQDLLRRMQELEKEGEDEE